MLRLQLLTAESLRRLATPFEGLPLADGRIVVVSAAGEDEVDGAYVEMAKPVVSNKEKRPSFVYAGRTRGNADIVMWWVDSASQWTIGKFPRTLDVASSSKTWYTSQASAIDIATVHPRASVGIVRWATCLAAGTTAWFQNWTSQLCTSAFKSLSSRTTHAITTRIWKHIKKSTARQTTTSTSVA